MFADVPEAKAFIELIRTDSGVMKTYNTYVVGFLEHFRSDGRLHPYVLPLRGQSGGRRRRSQDRQALVQGSSVPNRAEAHVLGSPDSTVLSGPTGLRGGGAGL